jgi:hypothetical protein
MRLIIEARLADTDGDAAEEDDGALAVVERPDDSLAELGLTLAEGRSLLAKVQAELISKQVQRWLSGQTHCRRCGTALSHKDSRSTVLRTIYGKINVPARHRHRLRRTAGHCRIPKGERPMVRPIRMRPAVRRGCGRPWRTRTIGF